MPNAPKTPTRTIRVSDDLWSSVQAKAALRGVTVTSVILAALEAYVAEEDVIPDCTLYDTGEPTLF